jgi:hypothetical protein
MAKGGFMISRYQTVNNGGLIYKEYFYTCDRCGLEMFEGDPRYNASGDLCCECAFLLGEFSPQEYKECLYWYPQPFEVAVHEGKVYAWSGKRLPWEPRSDKDYRATMEYKEWRRSVFIRDEFTCQKCQQIGGKLEAHHIKKFHKYTDLRYTVTNGLTLCRPCHMEEHGRGRHEVV